ncbi:MAG: hypothetical protein RJA99_3186 [Pseudomonadota bacterium]|jgi:hypothetical protein
MIPRDKLLHIGLGCLWLLCVVVSYWVLSRFGAGAFLAFQTTAYGALYEVNQWIRKEGQPDPWDAAATALPGWVAWGLLELTL